MALRCVGRRCCGAPTLVHTPSLFRLGLDADRRKDIAAVATEAGPVEALKWLVRRGWVSDDGAQLNAAQGLDSAWTAARRHSEAILVWEKRYSAWAAECHRLQEEYTAAQERRKKEQEDRERSSSSVTAAPSELILPPAPSQPQLATKGCYLWGEVGRGKTLLMDILALSVAESNTIVVKRLHFHDFMHMVHRSLHECRAEGAQDGIRAVINATASGRPAVLCLDEFQITAVADVTVLVPIFRELLQNNALVILTSNRHPESLYQDGLNRDRQMSAFVQQIQAELQVHHIDGATDYRAERKEEENSTTVDDYRVSENVSAEDEKFLDYAFASIAGDATPIAKKLRVAWGRSLQCDLVANGAARFSFDELCGANLSAEDYLALVHDEGVHSFIVSDVPRFNLRLHNEARRFTNFVDALYENHCRLICVAAAPVDELMTDMDKLCYVEAPPKTAEPEGAQKKFHKHGDLSFQVSELSPCRPDTFATAEADAEAGDCVIRVGGDDSNGADGIVGVMAAAVDSLRESGFAARRCVSRVHEMSTTTYQLGHNAHWGRTVS